jgi:nitrite reductase/ring-hydroxylating ferredoxin subunit
MPLNPPAPTRIPLCAIDELPEHGSRGFTIGRQSLFAVRRDDVIRLYLNGCPHLGVPLNWNPDQFLNLDGTLIQCATHGALFDIESGRCVAGPCLDEYLVPVPFELQDGMLVAVVDNPAA